MPYVRSILCLLAVVVFSLAAFEVPSPHVVLIPLGLALGFASLLVPGP